MLAHHLWAFARLWRSVTPLTSIKTAVIRVIKKDKLHSDYDQFWLSTGGKPLDDGYFLLPARIARKPINEVVNKKRSEYGRRYQLLDGLEQRVAKHFSTQQALVKA